MPKILLHTCCAPCVIYPLERLRQQGFSVTGYFYNPNIHPVEEHSRRKEALEELSQGLSLEVIYPEYAPGDYFQAIGTNVDVPQRCAICWELRLKESARLAKEFGFDYFTTTLLVSPYQDQQVLIEIGQRIQQGSGVKFYFEDFRVGFRKAHDAAKAQGVYCQKYCGCEFSIREKYKKSEKH